MASFQYPISTESDLQTFLDDSLYINGQLNDSISLSSGFKFHVTSKKILTSSVKSILTKTYYQPPSFSVEKDMDNEYYTSEFDPQNYSHYFPDMAPFTNENIVAGDKAEELRLVASYWSDLGSDVFDDWGYFYLYDVLTGKYYFPIISPQNQNDGVISTQNFNAFERTFTIKHGWATYGVFKFDISVNDNMPFKFGAYGNMGSDGDEVNTDLTYSYSLGLSNKTLHYLKMEEDGDDSEVLYSYFIPKNQLENNAKAYDLYQTPGEDNNSLMTKQLTEGVLVYFAKTADAKVWVSNDVKNSLL